MFWFFATESCCFVIVLCYCILLFCSCILAFCYWNITTCTFVISFWHLAIENCSFVIALWHFAIGTLRPTLLLLCTFFYFDGVHFTLVFFQGATIRPIVPRHNHSIVFNYCSPLNFLVSSIPQNWKRQEFIYQNFQPLCSVYVFPYFRCVLFRWYYIYVCTNNLYVNFRRLKKKPSKEKNSNLLKRKPPILKALRPLDVLLYRSLPKFQPKKRLLLLSSN